METTEIKPVFLDTDKCNGCVSCMKRCPTEAIRVRGGKAAIMYDRCVGCGECVKVCPTKAKKETRDQFSMVKDYKYSVAVPSPSIYGQFNNLSNINYVLNGLIKLGFNDVYDTAMAAEEISAATQEYLNSGNAVKPLINSACPAITHLIRMRYEHLIPHLSPFLQPEVLAVKAARRFAEQKTGLSGNDIGIFVITQCAANVMELKNMPHDAPDGVLSFADLYVPLLSEMNKLIKNSNEPLIDFEHCGKLGISWGCSTGEAVGIGIDNFLAADGIENVITVLNELEHEKLNNLDFLELYACTSGCVGGSMNIENPFLARTRLRLLRKKSVERAFTKQGYTSYLREGEYSPKNVYKLDDNMLEAMKKMQRVKELFATLPQINCGACGAPNCMAFAEDVVKGLKVRCKYSKDKEE